MLKADRSIIGKIITDQYPNKIDAKIFNKFYQAEFNNLSKESYTWQVGLILEI